jgi:hypothetical protein
LVIAGVPARAVIVDRVAISVANRVITLSEIDLRIRLTAFENGIKPDFSPTSRKQATERLIDQRLVEREMDLGRYPRLAPARREQLLADYATENFSSDAAALGRALAGYELTPADLAEDLARQADLLTFLGLRFRPAGNTSNEQADSEMEAWLKDQRARIRIEYLQKDLAP